jgi:hypothetical protein
MFGRVKMLGGMLILRRIATTHVPAFQARPQMHPSVAYFDAFRAAL